MFYVYIYIYIYMYIYIYIYIYLYIYVCGMTTGHVNRVQTAGPGSRVDDRCSCEGLDVEGGEGGRGGG